MNDGYSLTILNGDVVDSVALLEQQRAGALRRPRRLRARTEDSATAAARSSRRGPASARPVSRSRSEGPARREQEDVLALSAAQELPRLRARPARDEPTFVRRLLRRARASSAHQPERLPDVSLVPAARDAELARNTEDDRGPTSEDTADAGTDLITLQHRWLPLDAHRARDHGTSSARETGATGTAWTAADCPDSSELRQWGLRSDATLRWAAHRVEGGFLLRRSPRMRSERCSTAHGLSQWRLRVRPPALAARSVPAGHVDGRAGTTQLTVRRARWLRARPRDARLPRASAGLSLSTRTKLSRGLRRLRAVPAFHRLFGGHGNPAARAERTTTTPRRGAPLSDPPLPRRAYDSGATIGVRRPPRIRLVDGTLCPPRPVARAPATRSRPVAWRRGVPAAAQRKRPFGLDRLRASPGAAGTTRPPASRFDCDFDQRHTLNAYASYRVEQQPELERQVPLRQQFPIAGFYARPSGVRSSADERNLLRVPVYSRLDLRATKAVLLHALEADALRRGTNVSTARTTATRADGSTCGTGRVFLDTDTLFPFLP